MEQFGNNRCVVIVANVLIAANAVIHFISTGEILNWGTYLDVHNQQPTQSQFYYNRVPIAEYLIIIGIFMLVSACLSVTARLCQGEKSFVFALCCWYGTIFVNAFNFALGVFLMIWLSFNDRFISQNHIVYADLPAEYRSMYSTIALDGSYTLVVGFICSILLFTQDNYMFAKCKINDGDNPSSGKRTSEIPKLNV